MTLEKPLWVASSSKMVFVVRAMQMVEQGLLKLHDPVNRYLPYWAQDSSDPRSQVTLFHLLSFQSGYTFGLTKVDSCWLKPWLNFSACVERLYDSLPLGAAPGTVWDYNEFHNQVVAAVLEKVTGTDIYTLLSEDLKSWNMTHSRYPHHFGPGGPDVSADLVTTAVDYEQFMMQHRELVALFWRLRPANPSDEVGANAKAVCRGSGALGSGSLRLLACLGPPAGLLDAAGCPGAAPPF